METLRRYKLSGSLAISMGLLLVVPLLVAASLLTIGPIGGSSEAREAHVAALVFERGDWILPLRNGLIPSKPPLYHWSVAGVRWATGSSAIFAARVTSLLYGLLLLLTIGWAAVRSAQLLLPSMLRAQEQVALAAIGILLTSYGFLAMLGNAMVDMTFAAFTTVAIVAYLGGRLRILEDRLTDLPQWAWSTFFVACGLAVLAKGPLGMALPVVVCVGHSVMEGLLHGTVRGEIFRWIRPRIGWFVFMIISVSWYVLAVGKGGSGFVERQLLFENLRRFFGGEHVNAQPWWFYAPEIVRISFPWSILFFGLLVRHLRQLRNAHALRSPEEFCRIWLSAFGAWWVLSGILLCSLSVGKRTSYLLPLLPGLALFVGLQGYVWIEQHVGAVKWRARVFRYMREAALTLAVALAVLIECATYYPQVDRPELLYLQGWAMQVRSSLHGAGLVLLMGAAICGWYERRTFLTAGVTSWALVASLFVLAVEVGSGAKQSFKGFERTAQAVTTIVPRAAPLGVIRAREDEYFDPLLFYLGREVSIVGPQRLACQGCLAGDGFFLGRERDRNALTSTGCEVLSSWEFLQEIDRLRSSRGRAILLFQVRCPAAAV